MRKNFFDSRESCLLRRLLRGLEPFYLSLYRHYLLNDVKLSRLLMKFLTWKARSQSSFHFIEKIRSLFFAISWRKTKKKYNYRRIYLRLFNAINKSLSVCIPLCVINVREPSTRRYLTNLLSTLYTGAFPSHARARHSVIIYTRARNFLKMQNHQSWYGTRVASIIYFNSFWRFFFPRTNFEKRAFRARKTLAFYI